MMVYLDICTLGGSDAQLQKKGTKLHACIGLGKKKTKKKRAEMWCPFWNLLHLGFCWHFFHPTSCHFWIKMHSVREMGRRMGVTFQIFAPGVNHFLLGGEVSPAKIAQCAICVSSPKFTYQIYFLVEIGYFGCLKHAVFFVFFFTTMAYSFEFKLLQLLIWSE